MPAHASLSVHRALTAGGTTATRMNKARRTVRSCGLAGHQGADPGGHFCCFEKCSTGHRSTSSWPSLREARSPSGQSAAPSR